MGRTKTICLPQKEGKQNKSHISEQMWTLICSWMTKTKYGRLMWRKSWWESVLCYHLCHTQDTQNHDITLFDSSLVFRFKLFLHGYRLLTLANLCMYILTISGSGHSNFLITSEHWFNCVNTSTTDEENNACSALFWNCKQKKISLE